MSAAKRTGIPPKPGTHARPSASILLLSAHNEILLLHRVTTSRSFPSAHVFPGGNLSALDGPLPGVGDPARHVDSRAYRVGAIRECFEESGVVLARERGDAGGMLWVGGEEREKGRIEVYAGSVGMEEWVGGEGGKIDVEGLIPFTRWITPPNLPQRYSTQMYLYLLPLHTHSPLLPDTNNDANPPPTQPPDSPTSVANSNSNGKHPHAPSTLIPPPTPDGGIEHTAASFLPPLDWLAKAQSREIILPTPQFYLLHLVSRFITNASTSPLADTSHATLQAQRDALLRFLETPPKKGPAWRDMCISPMPIGKVGDGRVVLGLDWPGEEVDGQAREGDGERVVLLRARPGGLRDLELRMKEDVEMVGDEKGGVRL
ncbi:MAG: hypothetical protein M1813_005323 [Trichoglossum hirsutum]|nr:MAG: hypothetical protein M1813_005323 [Trichoglossum hirsutum]